MKELFLIEREHLQALLDIAINTASDQSEIAPHVIAARLALDTPIVRELPKLQEQRGWFEGACKASRTYNFPLGAMVVNKKFCHFIDSDTDSAYAGYRAGFIHGVRWSRHEQVLREPAVCAADAVTEVTHEAKASTSQRAADSST